MTIGMVIGPILLPFAWALLATVNKAHRADTGVDAPTRNAMRNIRRNARRKGISEEQAYREWLQRQQRRPPHRRLRHSLANSPISQRHLD